MRTLLSWKSVAISLVLLALLAAPAGAQSPAIRVDVPFAFTAANQTLPAGSYRFTVDTERAILRIDSLEGTAVWIAFVMPGGSSRRPGKLENGLLRFRKYGSQYLLSEVWRPGTVDSAAVAGSRVPRAVAGGGVYRDVRATK